MKKVIVSLTILLLTASVANAVNLAGNGDFENSTPLDQWFHSLGASEVSDNGPSAAGVECATMTSTPSAGGDDIRSWAVPVTPGDVLTLSFDYKTDANAAPSPSYWRSDLRFFTSQDASHSTSGTFLGESVLHLLSTNGVWQSSTRTYTVPAGAAYADLRFSNKLFDYTFYGTTRIDNVVLLPPPTAYNPDPASGATNVDLHKFLSWYTGQGAASHNVYFGETNSPAFQGNQSGTTFSPVLVPNTKYYWRIDEVNDTNVVTPGHLWNFTTVSAQATNPDPANGAINVVYQKVLHWAAGPTAASHDVYFGTSLNDVNNTNRMLGDLNGSGTVDWDDILLLAQYWLTNPAGTEPYAGVDDDDIVDFFDYALFSQDWLNSASPVFRGNQDSNSYDPGALELSTAYYWRIDEVNGPETTKGNIWSFTTQSGKASTPNPADNATGVALNATLSWAAGAGAVSHDVHFGTANPPEFQRNQSAVAFDPGALTEETTYYWQIDERTAGDVVSYGDVWSFRTLTPSPGLSKGPYLIYDGNNPQMTVLWQMPTTQSCTLAWSLDTSYSTSTTTTEYGSDHQHKYTITGLTPGTKYYYRVTTSTGWTYGSFRTAPAIDATSVKFLAYGDTRSGVTEHGTVCSQIVSTFTNDSSYQTMLLHVGDWVASDTENNWRDEYFTTSVASIPQMEASLPIMGCRGNHEGTGAVYTKYWPFPYVAAGKYWSYDYGPAHIAVVDQFDTGADGIISSTQLAWLATDLSSSTKKWKFIVLHEPGWSAGGGHSNNTQVQSAIQPLCEAYGVQIIFGGHNHYYARAVVNGVHHVTTGAGGAPFHTPNQGAANVVITAQVLEFCKVDIDGDSMVFQAVKSDGTVIDTFAIDQEEPLFTVVQTTDAQMNMCLNSAASNPVEWIRTIRDVNIINPAFMIHTGDQVNSSGSATQVTAYKNAEAKLNAWIPHYEVPGNHDVGLPPTQTGYNWYLANFGSLWYSFSVGNTLFIVLEANVLKDPSLLPDKATEEINWLTSTLASSSEYTNKIVFMHIPLACDSLTESETSSNMPVARRQQLLSLFHQYGVQAVFAGHLHQNRLLRDGEIEIVTTSSCTCPLGADLTGVRIIKVYSNHITHEYKSLNDIH